MAENDNTPPSGEGKLPAEGLAILHECAIAAETVMQGLERVSNLPGIPQSARDELLILQGLAKQLNEAFENLRDWLHHQFGVTLAGLGDGGNGEPQS
jgi:hypothetical protein